MHRKPWSLVVLLAALLPAGVAAAEADERPMQVEYEHIGYVVNPDGSYVESRATATKVLKEAALGSAKDASVSYSTSIQQAEVIEAYTLKPDGRRIAVPKGNYQVSASSGRDGDSPVYSDRTTLSVVFPELAVGDTTVFAYRLTASKPMFDRQFSMIESFSPAVYYGDVRITIDAPASLVARHRAWQMQEATRSRDGRSIVEWTWQNRSPVKQETLTDTVFNIERYPGYAFSTFASYADIARAYGGPAEAKAVPTARIRALADEIAGDAKDQREIAKRLYEWVSRSITYAGNCIGLGAVVPRDLDVVLDNRMGDCKDHATLLQALLAAKGIQSTQALINAGSVYTLPDIPVASMVNHVINYIPSQDLYLDSTAATAPFGSLPEAVAGKPVLLVAGDREARTPAQETGRDGQRLSTVLRIQPDGSVTGTQKIELRGSLAVAARDQFRDMPTSDAELLVKRYFARGSLRATGAVQYPDPKPLLEQFSLDASFDVAQMLPAAGGLQLHPMFVTYAPVTSLVAMRIGSEDQPAGESSCGSMSSEEHYDFEFPATMRVAALPQDISLEYGNVTYTATHRQQGNHVLVTRVFDDRTPGPTCSSEYNAGYAALMRRILPGLRSQIVYLPTAGQR